MVFYFSGTGSSKYVAELIAKNTADKAVSIADCLKEERFTFNEQKIGFVFPVHAWQPPLFVQSFIKKITVENAEKAYFYAVYVCGDESGYASKTLRKLFAEKGWSLSADATVVMPNNYIIAFGTDSDEIAKQKISDTTEKINAFSEKLNGGETVSLLKCGKFPALKTYIIAPFFQKHMLNAKPFHIEGDCIGCKICENNCPVSNIKVTDKTVTWGQNCTMCLACIHRCPVKVIQYGRRTQTKGRFHL